MMYCTCMYYHVGCCVPILMMHTYSYRWCDVVYTYVLTSAQVPSKGIAHGLSLGVCAALAVGGTTNRTERTEVSKWRSQKGSTKRGLLLSSFVFFIRYLVPYIYTRARKKQNWG